MELHFALVALCLLLAWGISLWVLAHVRGKKNLKQRVREDVTRWLAEREH